MTSHSPQRVRRVQRTLSAVGWSGGKRLLLASDLGTPGPQAVSPSSRPASWVPSGPRADGGASWPLQLREPIPISNRCVRLYLSYQFCFSRKL